MTETLSRQTTEPSTISRADALTSFSLADFPVPNGKEEIWRFTPMRRIRPLLTADSYDAPVSVSVQEVPGVVVELVDRQDSRLGKVMAPGDRPAALAWENFAAATVITIPEGTEVEEPVYVRVQAPDAPAATHILINAEAMSKATVILLHEGPAELVESVEVRAHDAANLNVVTVHEWDRNAVHTSSHRVSVGRDATVKHMVVTLGGDLVRVSVDTEFTGPGASLYLNGVYFVDAGQHQEHRPFIHHDQPNCFSRATYKGALQGKDARAVWVGDCLIGKNGDATDTYELNRNLILTEGAKADSVPNLEIENGEIEGAGHASATGRFDDDQLFYLMSRGVPPLEAKRLVIRGFFAEVINEMGVKDLQERLMDAIDHELRDYDQRLAELEEEERGK